MTILFDTADINALVTRLATKKGAQLEHLANVLINREFLLTVEEFDISVSKNDIDKNVYTILRQWREWNDSDVQAEVIYQAVNRATKDGITDLDKAAKELVKLTKAVLYLGNDFMETLTGCQKVKDDLHKVQKELDDLTNGV